MSAGAPPHPWLGVLEGCHREPNAGPELGNPTSHMGRPLGPPGALRNTDAHWGPSPGDSDVMVWVRLGLPNFFQSPQGDPP